MNIVTLQSENQMGRCLHNMRERDRRTAEHFHIVNQCEKLEKDLMNIDGVSSVEFDLDGFWDNMHQVILVIGYDIPRTLNTLQNYYEKEKEMLSQIISTAATHDLSRTEDTIEDYGAHFYFVFKHGREWIWKN